jgi:hypothetical protein
MNLLTTNVNKGIGRSYLATFARIPVYGSRGIEMPIKVNDEDRLDNEGKTVTARLGQKEISDAVQNQKRTAISIPTARLTRARAGGPGASIDLKGLAPSQVDVVDRVYRGRNASLGLENPEGSPLYEGFIKSNGKAASKKRLQAKDKRKSARLIQNTRGTTDIPAIQNETVGDLFEEAKIKQRTSVSSRDAASLGAREVDRIAQKKAALMHSKQLDAFYKKLNSGQAVSPEEEERAVRSLQSLVEQKRTIRSGKGSKVTPLEDLLGSSRRVDYITRNAKPAEVKLDVAARDRLKKRLASNPTAPSYAVREANGTINPTKASYNPVQRTEGQTSAIGRRASLLENVKATVNAADEQTQGNASSLGREALYKALKNRDAGVSATRTPKIMPNIGRSAKSTANKVSNSARAAASAASSTAQAAGNSARTGAGNAFTNVAGRFRQLSTGGKLKAAAGALGVLGAGAVATGNLMALRQQVRRESDRNRAVRRKSNAPDYDYERYNVRY